MDRLKITLLKSALMGIVLVTLLLCILWLPYMANESVRMFPEVAFLKYPMLFGIYATAIPFIYALYEAVRLLNFISRDSAFTEEALYSLKYIKYCAYTIILLYVAGLVMLDYFNALGPGMALLGLVIIFASFVITLFEMVLQQLFRHSISLKQENELTI